MVGCEIGFVLVALVCRSVSQCHTWVRFVGPVRGIRGGLFPTVVAFWRGLDVLRWGRLVVWAYRSVQPSLQALRAETMVERFTARIHVASRGAAARMCFWMLK